MEILNKEHDKCLESECLELIMQALQKGLSLSDSNEVYSKVDIFELYVDQLLLT